MPPVCLRQHRQRPAPYCRRRWLFVLVAGVGVSVCGGLPCLSGLAPCPRCFRPSGNNRGVAATRTRLVTAVEMYFDGLRRVRASGGATGERSFYPPLADLLDTVGGTLKPRMFCVSELAEQGAGHPDFGLYTAGQVQKGRPREGQMPERGVVEVKAARDDAWLTADGSQVSSYWGRCRLVLVTNTSDFVLVGEGSWGEPVTLESYSLADTAEQFESRLEKPGRTRGRSVPGWGSICAGRCLTVPRSPSRVIWPAACLLRMGWSCPGGGG